VNRTDELVKEYPALKVVGPINHTKLTPIYLTQSWNDDNLLFKLDVLKQETLSSDQDFTDERFQNFIKFQCGTNLRSISRFLSAQSFFKADPNLPLEMNVVYEKLLQMNNHLLDKVILIDTNGKKIQTQQFESIDHLERYIMIPQNFDFTEIKLLDNNSLSECFNKYMIDPSAKLTTFYDFRRKIVDTDILIEYQNESYFAPSVSTLLNYKHYHNLPHTKKNEFISHLIDISKKISPSLILDAVRLYLGLK